MYSIINERRICNISPIDNWNYINIKLVIGNIDLSKTLTPEEKYEIITRNLQVWIYYFNLCM